MLSPSASSKNWAPSAEGAQLKAKQAPLPQAFLIHHRLQPFWQDESGLSLVHRCAPLSTCRTMISLHHPAHPKISRDLPEPTDTISNNLRSGSEHLELEKPCIYSETMSSPGQLEQQCSEPSGQHLSLRGWVDSPTSSLLQPCTCCQTRCSLSLAPPSRTVLAPMETVQGSHPVMFLAATMSH